MCSKKFVYPTLLMLLIFLAGCNLPVATPTPTSPPPAQALTGDFTPCWGRPSGEATTPRRGRALMAYSSDGINFHRPQNPNDGILVDGAGVPDAVVLPNGRILVYYVPGCRDYNGTRDYNDVKIAVAVSDRQGVTGSWIFKDVQFTGIPESEGLTGVSVDPNVVLLPDGNLRLFVTMWKRVNGAEQNGAYSFSSKDGGFTYSYEGFRYGDILDPENYRFSDSNWQIITGGPQGYAISTDGGNVFTSRGQFSPVFENVVHDIAVTEKPGEYRAYAITPTGLKSYLSTSAPWTTWTEEPGYRLQLDPATGLESCNLSFPTVVKIGPGNYLMVYLAIFPGCGCNNDFKTECR
jgi:hypothetical protein